MTTTNDAPSRGRALSPDEPAGVFVRTGVGDVHVKIDGDPSADVVCVFVHGLPGSLRDFTLAARGLAARGGCAVRVDMPGFGRSPPSSTLLVRPAERAALIADVMRARGHRRYAVCGHSFGGTTALALAAQADAVTAVVLACSVGITRHRGLTIPHELTGVIAGLRTVPVVGGPLTAPFVGRFRAAAERLGVRGDRPFSDDELVAQAKVIGGLDFADLRRYAASVRVSVLVLSAEDDRLVEPAVGFTLAAALRAAPLVTHHHRAQGGHFLQHRAADVIADWLATVGRA